jgi:hypothetical protein
LPGYQFKFNKRSNKDGSGKGNIVRTDSENDVVWGVVYNILESEKPALDTAEGLNHGYEELKLNVLGAEGNPIEAIAYIAMDKKYINENLVPYNWYKEHCLVGASEHNLPKEYIEILTSFEATDDPDSNRAIAEKSIYSTK